MKNNLIKKVLIIAIPTYTMALLTKAMVYTMPMLAITTVIATNLFDDTKENENRVDEGDGLDGGDVGDLDGQTSAAPANILNLSLWIAIILKR